MMRNKCEIEKMVSIVVPVYNAEKYIERCVNSILIQTYKNIEVIIIDDGSTDKSYEICKKFVARDSRVLLYKQVNKGSVEARKRGIECATGKYLMMVDSDDWIEDNMVEELMHYMNKYDVDMVLSGICYDYSQKEKNRVWLDGVTPGFYDLREKDSKLYDYFFLEKEGEHVGRGIRGHICTRLLKRNLIVDIIKQVDSKIKNGEDDVCLYPAILLAESIYVLDKAYYHYRIHDDSLCQNSTNRSLLEVELLDKALRGFVEKHFAAEKLLKQLNKYMYVEAKTCAKRIYHIKEVRRYIYPYDYLPSKSKIVIYGAGVVGKEYIEYIKRNTDYELMLWIDQNAENQENVQELSAIKNISFDYILLATLNRDTADSMRASIIDYVETPQVILWDKPFIRNEDVSY